MFSDVPICSKASRAYPHFYARKFLFCFPELELIAFNNVSGAKELRADVAQMQEGFSTSWGTNSLALHHFPRIDPGMRTPHLGLIHQNSRDVAVPLP